ncbi:helix-turn-helix domain-containing protein [Candidatus Albibeggiatoa sp. nov. BB20]|uniref:helix-turn-helix domain-containing protein n=1 Tax=Candidatus Albibeggiatoa sp. nov. BB20 TaxID=3162723 RepID=UPI003365A86A
MLAKKALTSSFLGFASQAYHILHIQSEQDYEEALEIIEYLFEQAEDKPDEPLNDLIDIVSKAIEQYESKQDDIILFDKEAKDINQGISAIRVLMEQHNLTATDLQDEIGSKSLVSMILNGKRNLTREHITKLSQRFNISPAIFFDLRVVS